MKAFKAIAAMAEGRVIGKSNTLPWNIPEELKWFKQCTLGHIIIMGRKTFDSLGRALPNRTTVVLTRKTPLNPVDGVHYINTIFELKTLNLDPNKEVWICGGAEIYSQTLPYCSDLYLTDIKLKIPEGDAFFPEFKHLFKAENIVAETDTFRIVHYTNPRPLALENELVKPK